ncbi:MAG: choice-of-anchor Q domain-containing protein [Paludibacter sp.]|nr:choice-of-anchor Q domain-containing protein [Paludibacter sp.]
MKKITLLLALVCSMSMFATRYLVQLGTGGAATWRAAEAGETLVDLNVAGQSFNAWYNATVVSGDEVWITKGTYLLNAVITIDQANHSVYGGFIGTETATSQREKVAEGSPWEFTNETILDGNNTVQVLFAGNAFANVLFDGLTITKSNAANAAAQYRDGVTIQQSKVINNNSTGNGGGVNFYNGGSLNASYVAGNVASVGGGVYSNLASAVSAYVSDCLIENNRANNTGGGGIRVQGAGPGITYVTNCIFRGNKGLDNAGTTAKPGGAISTNSINNKFVNCLVYNNQGTNSVFFSGGNLYNVTIVNNIGQVYIASATLAMSLTNCIVWGNKTDVTGETNTGITSNTTNTNVVINNTAVYPGLTAGTYTQSNNIALEISNDSQDNAKGPGFVSPTTFYGAPVGETQTTEMNASDWKIKYTSGCHNLGKTVAEVTTDYNGISRPQGASYDIGAYELPYYNTTVTFNTGGTVNALTSGDILSEPKGKPLAFTITPDTGKKIKSVLYNGAEVKSELVSGVYTAPALTASATLVVEFEVDLSTATNDLQTKIQCFAADGKIQLRGLSEGIILSVYSVTGATVYNQAVRASEMTLSVNKGIYIVKVNGNVTKVVVE